jgi:hypothetical protein
MKTTVDDEFRELDREFAHSEEINHIRRHADELAESELWAVLAFASIVAIGSAGLSMILWRPDVIGAVAGGLLGFALGFLFAVAQLSFHPDRDL